MQYKSIATNRLELSKLCARRREMTNDGLFACEINLLNGSFFPYVTHIICKSMRLSRSTDIVNYVFIQNRFENCLFASRAAIRTHIYYTICIRRDDKKAMISVLPTNFQLKQRSTWNQNDYNLYTVFLAIKSLDHTRTEWKWAFIMSDGFMSSFCPTVHSIHILMNHLISTEDESVVCVYVNLLCAAAVPINHHQRPHIQFYGILIALLLLAERCAR